MIGCTLRRKIEMLHHEAHLTLEVPADLLEYPELFKEPLGPVKIVADRIADSKFTTEAPEPAEVVIDGLIDTKFLTKILGDPEAVENFLGGT